MSSKMKINRNALRAHSAEKGPAFFPAGNDAAAPSENGGTPSAPAGKPLPKGFPPELIPLYDWWTKNGKSTLLTVALAAVAVLSVLWYRNSRRASQENAAAAISAAGGVSELETAAAARKAPELQFLLGTGTAYLPRLEELLRKEYSISSSSSA